MALLKPELKAILDRYGINPRDTSQVWDCHGTLVLYHKAYEIIAAKENIRFDPPTALQADGVGKSVALCVVGRMGDRQEWSVGEAAPGNNKNSYPFAMAEKRAKDRVVAKLVGLAQYVYSEDEADEFKEAARSPVQADPPAAVSSAVNKGEPTPRGQDEASDLLRRATVAANALAGKLDIVKTGRALDTFLDTQKDLVKKLEDFGGEPLGIYRRALDRARLRTSSPAMA